MERQSSAVETDNLIQIFCFEREIFILILSPEVYEIWWQPTFRIEWSPYLVSLGSDHEASQSLGGQKAMRNFIVWEATLSFWWRWVWVLGSTGTATLLLRWRMTRTKTGTLIVPSSSTSGEFRPRTWPVLLGSASDQSPSGVQHCPGGRLGVTNCMDWSSQVSVLSSLSSGWVLLNKIFSISTWPANYSGGIIISQVGVKHCFVCLLGLFSSLCFESDYHNRVEDVKVRIHNSNISHSLSILDISTYFWVSWNFCQC